VSRFYEPPYIGISVNFSLSVVSLNLFLIRSSLNYFCCCYIYSHGFSCFVNLLVIVLGKLYLYNQMRCLYFARSWRTEFVARWTTFISAKPRTLWMACVQRWRQLSDRHASCSREILQVLSKVDRCNSPTHRHDSYRVLKILESCAI